MEKFKSTPYAPMSPPFIERLIETIRRDSLDHTLLGNSIDIHRKLDTFRIYYSAVRFHPSLNRTTPAIRAGNALPSKANLAYYAGKRPCDGLFETSVAA